MYRGPSAGRRHKTIRRNKPCFSSPVETLDDVAWAPRQSTMLPGAFALTLECLVLASTVASFSVPSPSSIGSDVTLLYYNDLDGELFDPISYSVLMPRLLVYTASEHRSVLLLSPFTNVGAVSACAGLGETLLPVNETFFRTELKPLLQYQTYLGQYRADQLYWVQSSDDACEAIDALGLVVATTCDSQLPVLCSQSAPLNASADPTNSLTVRADDLTITG